MFLPIFLIILLLSILWAWYSMRDFELPKEVREVIRELRASRIRGVIVRFQKGFRHYSIQPPANEREINDQEKNELSSFQS